MGGSSKVFRDGLLDGRVAIVTGGGTNLGRAAAAELVACGARVVIAGRRAEVLEEAAAALGDACTWVAGDIREEEDAARIVFATVERHGRVDVLVNNAGGQYFVPAEAIAAKGWRAVQRLNVEGTMTMTGAAVPALAAVGGTVVNVTVSPHHGMPAMAHTGAARAAVEALTTELAEQLRDDGVGVVAAAIGRFDTESLRKYPEQVWRGAAATVPLGRLGRMDEFATLIAMLASGLGAGLSGTVVTLDGAVDNWWGPWPPASITDPAGTVPTETRPA
jgi:citronellol/citronellal dehydrogenase